MMLPVKYDAPETPELEMRLSVASIVSFTCAFQLRPAFDVTYTAPAVVVISALFPPNAVTELGSPGSFGESGTRSHDLPPSVVCRRIAGFPMTQPSLSLNDTFSNR